MIGQQRPEVKPVELTTRQQEVATLVRVYYEVAHEIPSSGWVARRLSISRQTAREHIQTLRRKGWFGPYRERR